MSIPWEKIPQWLFAATLFLFMVIMLLTLAIPGSSFHLYDKEFGFAPVPVWKVRAEIKNDTPSYPGHDSVISLNMPAKNGFCFLTSVTIAPSQGIIQTARVRSDGNDWYLQNIGAVTSRAACVEFRSKWANPEPSGVAP
jgi:hypothetical protein